MKLKTDYKSRFRLGKGGRVSLVVSALLVSISLSTPANALQVTGAETTTQNADTTSEDLEVTSSGTITINNNDFNTRALENSGNVNANYSVSNAGIITLTNSSYPNHLFGIDIKGNNAGTISNSNIIDVTNSYTGKNAFGINIGIGDNTGNIILGGTRTQVTADSHAVGLYVKGSHTGGTITNSADLIVESQSLRADGIFINNGMSNATIINSDTTGYIKAEGDKAYGINVGETTTDSTITNDEKIYALGGSKAKALAFQTLSGTTTITNSDSLIANATTGTAYGIAIGNVSTVNEIVNSGTIEVSGGSGKGIWTNSSLTGDITNSGSIIVENIDSGAEGIEVRGAFTGDLLNSDYIKTVSGTNNIARGITVTNLNSGSTITNSGTIKSNSFNRFSKGIDVSSNYGSIINDGTINVDSQSLLAVGIGTNWGDGTGTIENTVNGTITSESTDGIARGIYAWEDEITNTGTITANSTTSSAQGIYTYYADDISNSGTITAHVNGTLHYGAHSIYVYQGGGHAYTITNTGTLNGNIFTTGSLTNSGTINLPHNANAGATKTAISDFTNEASGTLTIGLQTDGTTTTHSKLYTADTTFESGSTINVDVTSASTNVGDITGERLDDILVATSSLTVNGTINVTDNSALLDFELIDDANSIQDDTIDLSVVEANAGGGNIANTSTLGNGNANTKKAAVALDTIQAGNHPAMTSVFTALNALSTNEAVAKAVESTTPQNTGASVGAASQISGGITGIVEQRQNVTLGGGLNSGDEMFTNKNVWFKPFGSLGKQNDKDGLNGFDLKAYGVGIGVDGEINPNQTLGFAFFYTNANVDVNKVAQESNLDVFTTLVYGNMPIIDEKTKFLYQLGYALQKTSGERSVFTGDIATSDYTSKTASLDLKLVRDYKINDNLLLQPIVSATYRHFTNPAYSETGAGALNLDVQKFTSSELIASLGTMAYYKLDNDSKLIGNVNVGYDFHDKQQSVTASYQGASGVTFDTDGIDNGRWSYEAGIGYERDINENSNINFSYNYQAQGSSFANNTISAKYVLKF